MKARQFQGAGVTLAADVGGDPEHPAVILMHGGGQTRGSWGKTARELVRGGRHVISLDLRGHGESTWATDGDYRLDAFAADLRQVIATLARPPALVGASLGGLTALMAVGESDKAIASALVLVDVAHTVDAAGAENVIRFMEAAPDGFASVEEAAEAVAAYLPHRPRPKVTGGLIKNLRKGKDGRYRWHWDPQFIRSVRKAPLLDHGRMAEAARRVKIPTQLIRGGRSDVVTAEAAAEFRRLVPAAEYVEIGSARHMIAGDSNDNFTAIVSGFLVRHGEAED
ncbi:alpha/beta fold hydrolase [Magnetospirillum sp. 15-1]|uniref:alpha/beta fold hydrolase n=1 Tax=Magnetospirillum sp. 15-1 TaxID=1979370 RepID=UPI001481F524|nr:alpha/beta fold hydrolase [Magnetospirillum sp. 15-1]